jgi:hypothetical protein
MYRLLNEDMLVYYLEQLKMTFWMINKKSGQIELIINNNENEPINESVNEIRNVAKLKLIQNLPGIKLIFIIKISFQISNYLIYFKNC